MFVFSSRDYKDLKKTIENKNAAVNVEFRNVD